MPLILESVPFSETDGQHGHDDPGTGEIHGEFPSRVWCREAIPVGY
jgi:hypothetical protein